MKPIMLDFDITKMNGEEQTELKNNCVRIEFGNCYFEVEINQYERDSISVRKIAKDSTNTDQLNILPHSTNSVYIK